MCPIFEQSLITEFLCLCMEELLRDHKLLKVPSDSSKQIHLKQFCSSFSFIFVVLVNKCQ